VTTQVPAADASQIKTQGGENVARINQSGAIQPSSAGDVQQGKTATDAKINDSGSPRVTTGQPEVIRTVAATSDQPAPQIKSANTNIAADQGRVEVTGQRTEPAVQKTEVAASRPEPLAQKVEPAVTPTAAVAKPDIAASTAKVDVPVGGTQPVRTNLDSPTTAGTAVGTKQDGVAKPVVAEGSQALPGGQSRTDVKGDYISTQAFTNTTGRADASRGVETNAAQKLVDPAIARDQKLVGTSESGGPRIESGVRGEQKGLPGEQSGVRGDPLGLRGDQTGLQPGGKQDSSKPDFVRSIEGKVEGAKQTQGTEGRIPGSDTPNVSTKQPGTTDSATGGRQPGIDGGGKTSGTTDGVGGKPTAGVDGSSPAGREPSSEGGGKSTGGGGSGIAGDSTKKIDIGSPSGGRSEGQPGGPGMGGGSSAPIDRAPHKPFGVEDAQGGGKTDAGTGKGAGSAGAGPRFDTGETRGGEVGQRFDTPDLRGGKMGAAGGSSDVGGAKGVDIGAGKGSDIGGKGGTGGGTGFSGSGESSMLGDKRQPPIIPDGVVTGKGGKGLDGLIGGPKGDDSVPFILPGALGGKDGGRRQSDQIFADKSKGGETPGKSDATRPDAFTAQKSGGQKPDSTSGSGVPVDKGGDKGQKSDAGIAAGIPGAAGAAGAAEIGGSLKNFAQNFLADDKTGKGGAKTGDTVRAGDAAGMKTGDANSTNITKASTDGTKDPTSARQDFAGPGQKTRILGTDQTIVGAANQTAAGSTNQSGDQAIAGRVVGPGAAGGSGDKDKKLAGMGDGAATMDGGEDLPRLDEESVPVEEFDLPQVDLLGEAEEVEEADENVEKSSEDRIEDEMHYELALGLQLYTAISQAPYGAYHYHTKEGDTVESVAREIVGDVRTAPLVFSLNKDHIIASTEYGSHPFQPGVMIQLPTPRDLKEFFGKQT